MRKEEREIKGNMKGKNIKRMGQRSERDKGINNRKKEIREIGAGKRKQ
jgi:hypothetical protein